MPVPVCQSQFQSASLRLPVPLMFPANPVLQSILVHFEVVLAFNFCCRTGGAQKSRICVSHSKNHTIWRVPSRNGCKIVQFWRISEARQHAPARAKLGVVFGVLWPNWRTNYPISGPLSLIFAILSVQMQPWGSKLNAQWLQSGPRGVLG